MTRMPLFAVVVPLVFATFACGEDLGTCGADEGRVPIAIGTDVQYLGQALMNGSCATGCHASGAEGPARVGAPAGLDFDLRPVAPTGTATKTDAEGKTITYATADAGELAGLRQRQRKVFDNRELIWGQISDSLMPPSGVGDGFRNASPGEQVTISGSSCTREGAYPAFSAGAMRDALRNWLACGAPIVELNSAAVTPKTPGNVGDQFPACGIGGDGDGDGDGSIEAVQTAVFTPSCVNSCHQQGGLFPSLDLSSAESSYAGLMGDGSGNVAPLCGATANGPFVVPGDPEGSFLYDKLANTSPSCGSPMPVGGMLSAEALQLVADWIMGGAPAPGEAGNSSDAGM